MLMNGELMYFLLTQGGVLPNIQAVLLPKKAETKVGKLKSQSQEY